MCVVDPASDSRTSRDSSPAIEFQYLLAHFRARFYAPAFHFLVLAKLPRIAYGLRSPYQPWLPSRAGLWRRSRLDRRSRVRQGTSVTAQKGGCTHGYSSGASTWVRQYIDRCGSNLQVYEWSCQQQHTRPSRNCRSHLPAHVNVSKDYPGFSTNQRTRLVVFHASCDNIACSKRAAARHSPGRIQWRVPAAISSMPKWYPQSPDPGSLHRRWNGRLGTKPVLGSIMQHREKGSRTGIWDTHSGAVTSLLPQGWRKCRSLLVETECLKSVLYKIINGCVVKLKSFHPRWLKSQSFKPRYSWDSKRS